MNFYDKDAPVIVWIDCGRSFVTADEYATALGEIERLRAENERLRRRLGFDEDDRG